MNMIDGGRKLQPIGQQSDRTLVQVIAAPRNTSSSNPAYITQAAADGRYAPLNHTHVIGQVTGLQTALDGKASTSHNHDATYAPISHSHAIANVTGLQTALDGKASTSHNHDATYAPISHSHAIANVTGLQTALDGKASTTHGHFIADVGGLQTALDSKSNAGHSHLIADVANLQASLDGKAAAAHEHSAVDISSPFQGGALLMSPAAGQPLSALVPPYGAPGGLLRWSYTSWSFDSTSYALASHTHPWSEVTSKPTTLAGYNIAATDVTAQILSGYSLGSNAPIADSDSIRGAFGKAQAQINAVDLRFADYLPLSGGKRISGWIAFDATAYSTSSFAFGGYTLRQYSVEFHTAFSASGAGATWSNPMSFGGAVAMSAGVTLTPLAVSGALGSLGSNKEQIPATAPTVTLARGSSSQYRNYIVAPLVPGQIQVCQSGVYGAPENAAMIYAGDGQTVYNAIGEAIATSGTPYPLIGAIVLQGGSGGAIYVLNRGDLT